MNRNVISIVVVLILSSTSTSAIAGGGRYSVCEIDCPGAISATKWVIAQFNAGKNADLDDYCKLLHAQPHFLIDIKTGMRKRITDPHDIDVDDEDCHQIDGPSLVRWLTGEAHIWPGPKPYGNSPYEPFYINRAEVSDLVIRDATVRTDIEFRNIKTRNFILLQNVQLRSLFSITSAWTDRTYIFADDYHQRAAGTILSHVSADFPVKFQDVNGGGVWIEHSTFGRSLDLIGVRSEDGIVLNDVEIDSDFAISDVEIPLSGNNRGRADSIDLFGLTAKKKVSISGVRGDGSSVSLSQSHVQGDCEFGDFKLADDYRIGITVDASNIDHDFRLGALNARSVTIRSSAVGGDLSFGLINDGKPWLHDDNVYPPLDNGYPPLIDDGKPRLHHDVGYNSFIGAISFNDLKINGAFQIVNSSISDNVDAGYLGVRRDIFIEDSALNTINIKYSNANELSLRASKVGNFDLSGIELNSIKLDNVSWRRDGKLLTCPLDGPSGLDPACRLQDPSSPTLNLRNAHLAEIPHIADSWPPTLLLTGLRYDHIGDSGEQLVSGSSPFDTQFWLNWLARDPFSNPQPYTQLASVLRADGLADEADTVQYAEHERQRRLAWNRRNIREALWLTSYGEIAGFGIGRYTFRVTKWIFLISCVGGGVLMFSPIARSRGILWCMAATLHRLLPIFELSKQFQDFFDNTEYPPTHSRNSRRRDTHAPARDGEGTPRAPNLRPWQSIFFGVVAVTGWILGFFLIAAMTGLSPR